MNQDSSGNHTAKILVSDFDGTMTRRDFFKLAVSNSCRQTARTSGASTLSAGSRIRGPAAVLRGDRPVRPRSWRSSIRWNSTRLAQAVADLRQAGWEVVVTSAGCDWYIRRLLAQATWNWKSIPIRAVSYPAKGCKWKCPSARPFSRLRWE